MSTEKLTFKQKIKMMRKDIQNDKKTGKIVENDQQITEYLQKLSESPEEFFSDIDILSDKLKSLSDKITISIYENFISCLKFVEKKNINSSYNIYEKNFETFLRNFKHSLNVKNKHNHSFIFMLQNNKKYDLMMRLIQFCKTNKIKLDLNIAENDVKEPNLLDELIYHFNSTNSILLKNKNYKLENNLNINNSFNIKLIEEQIDKETIILNKINQILNYLSDNFDTLINLEHIIHPDLIVEREKNKLFFFLKITKKINQFEGLIENTNKNIKDKKDFNDLINFIKFDLEEKNFSFYKKDVFLLLRTLLINHKLEECSNILKILKLNIDESLFFKFLFDIKEFSDKNTENDFKNLNYQSINLNMINMKSIIFDGNENYLTDENVFDLLFVIGICNTSANNIIKEHQKLELIEFLFRIINSQAIFQKIFIEIYSNPWKKTFFFKTLAMTNSLSMKSKLEILEKINIINRDVINIKGINQNIELNFYQLSFIQLKYIVKKIDLDNSEESIILDEILNKLNLNGIKIYVDVHHSNSYNIIDKSVEKLFAINSKFLNVDDSKKILKIFNYTKIELGTWLSYQNSAKKLENLINLLIKHETLDLNPMFYNQYNLNNNLFTESNKTSYKEINILRIINNICNKLNLTLDTTIVKKIIEALICPYDDKNLCLNISKNHNFIYKNLLISDVLDFTNLQIIRNKSLLCNNSNDAYSEESLLMIKFFKFINEIIQICSKSLIEEEIESLSKSTIINKIKKNDKIFEIETIQQNIYNKCSNNFTQKIKYLVEGFNKNPALLSHNIYYYYDNLRSVTRRYMRKLTSQEFTEQNQSNNHYYISVLNEAYKNKTNFNQNLNNLWDKGIDKLHYFQIKNLFKMNAIFNSDVIFENEFFLKNLFNVYESRLLNESLKEEIKSLFLNYFFTYIKRENIFKALSYLIDYFNQKNFPNCYLVFLEFIEELISKNFIGDKLNSYENENAANNIIFFNDSNESNFYEFLYFLIRDFILTDFSIDDRNYSARFNILIYLTKFLQRVRNSEFYDYFNLALHYTFKINFLNIAKSGDYEYKKDLSTRDNFVLNTENKTVPKDKRETSILYYDNYKKIRRIYDFKNLSADDQNKKSIKLKSLNIILHLNLSKLKNKNNLTKFMDIYSDIRNQIVSMDRNINYDLNEIFNNNYNSVLKDKKIKCTDKATNKINYKFFLSENLIQILLNNCDEISSNKNNENELIEDMIILYESYDILLNLLSEYFCYFDSKFFRDFFKKLFFKMSISKLDDNYRNCISTHLKFLEYQLRNFSNKIIPCYSLYKEEIRIKIESLSSSGKILEHMNELNNYDAKEHYDHMSRWQLNPKEEKIISKENQNEEKTYNYKKRPNKIRKKLTVEFSNKKIENTFLLNGINLNKIKSPFFLDIKHSEENKNMNNLLNEFNEMICYENSIFNSILNVNIKNKKRYRLFLKEKNALFKKIFKFNTMNFYELQKILLEIFVEDNNGNDTQNIFLEKSFNEFMGNNIILNILKSNFCFEDNFNVEKLYFEAPCINKCFYISFFDFSKTISRDFNKSEYTLKLAYNPFADILQKDFSNKILLNSYFETLFKLDRFNSNFNYETKKQDMEIFFENSYVIKNIFENSYNKDINSINLLIKYKNILGYDNKNNKYEKSLNYNDNAFEENLNLISKFFNSDINNNNEKINYNGVVYESLLYILELFLKNNNDLDQFSNCIDYSIEENIKYYHQYCIKKGSLCQNHKKPMKNIKELIAIQVKILTDIINIINIRENQNEFSTTIIGLVIKKVFLLYKICANYLNKTNQLENLNEFSNQKKKDNPILNLFSLLLEKSLNQTIFSNNPVSNNNPIFCKNLWFELNKLNLKILETNENFCHLYYDSLRKLFICDSTENENLKFFKKEFLEKNLHKEKFIILSLSIIFNDVECFEKIINISKGEILFEIINFDCNLISDYLAKNQEKNIVAKNLCYCYTNKLNAYHLLLLNNQNKKEFYKNAFDYEIIHLNFNSVFLAQNNILKKLSIKNPFLKILDNDNYTDNHFMKNYLLQSKDFLTKFNLESEAINYGESILKKEEKLRKESERNNDLSKSNSEEDEKNENSLLVIDFYNENAILKKLIQFLTSSEENLLFKSKENNSTYYFNFHKFIITLLKNNEIEYLISMKIHNVEVSKIMLANQNLYLKLFAKYIKNYETFEKLICYILSKNINNEYKLDYLLLFFEVLKVNNTNILKGIINENSKFNKNINFLSIFSEDELNIQEFSNKKDSINLQNNYCKNKTLNLLLFYCTHFNSKDALFFILEKITGKNIEENIINFDSTIDLKVKNCNYQIKLKPEFIKYSLYAKNFEIFVILLRLIKYEENWKMSFVNTKIILAKIFCLNEELFLKKNKNIYRFLSTFNKDFLFRLTFLWKIKLYIDNIHNYSDASCIENSMIKEDKNLFSSENYEIQNSLRDLLLNEIFIQYFLFSDSKNYEYLAMQDLLYILKKSTVKNFKIMQTLFLLILRIKPLDLSYFRDFISNIKIAIKDIDTSNFILLISFLEKILSKEKQSFLLYANPKMKDYDDIIDLVFSIQNQDLKQMHNNLSFHHSGNYFDNKIHLKEDLEYLNSIEADFMSFLNKNSFMTNKKSFLSGNENMDTLEYSRKLYDLIKENIFSYDIYYLFKKDSKNVKIILYDYLDENKNNSIKKNLMKEILINYDESTLECRETDNINVRLSYKYILFRELLTCDNLFLMQLHKFVNKKHQLSSSNIIGINNENELLKENIIQEFYLNLDRKYYSPNLNMYLINYGDYTLTKLRNIIVVNTSNLFGHTFNSAGEINSNNLIKYNDYLEKLKMTYKEDKCHLSNKEKEEEELNGENMFSNSDAIENSDILMHFLIFDQSLLIKVLDKYFFKIENIFKEELKRKINKKKQSMDNPIDHMTIIEILKEKKKTFNLISKKLQDYLFEENQEINIFRSTINKFDKSILEKIFEALNINYENRVKEIFKIFIDKIKIMLGLHYFNKDNFIEEINFLEDVFESQRKNYKIYLEENLNLNMLNNNENSVLPKFIVKYFVKLIFDLEILDKVLAYYISVTNILLYMENISDEKIHTFKKCSSIEKFQDCEIGFLMELSKNLFKYLLKIKIVPIKDSSKILSNSSVQNQNFYSSAITDIKNQLTTIHLENAKAVSSLIFDPIIYIFEKLENTEYKPYITKEELKNLKKNLPINQTGFRKLKYEMKELQKKDIKEYETKNFGKYFFTKFLQQKISKDDFIAIPIDFNINFSITNFAMNIIQKIKNSYSKNKTNLNKEEISNNLNDSMLSNKENTLPSSKKLFKKSSLTNPNLIADTLYNIYYENNNSTYLDDYIIKIIDKIILMFNTIIYGGKEPKSQIDRNYKYNQWNDLYYLSSGFYLLADFYRDLIKDFNSFDVTKSIFLKTFEINKENFDLILERINFTKKEKKANNLIQITKQDSKLFKRLLNLNIKNCSIEIENWFYDMIQPKIYRNEKTLNISLIKNYVLIDSMIGKLTYIHTEDFVKMISIIYNESIETNEMFLKLIPQFQEYFETFICKTKNFSINNFFEIYTQVYITEKNEIEDNIHKFINPYKFEEQFDTFISKVRFLINVFYINKQIESYPTNTKNKISFAKEGKFNLNIIMKNIDRVFLGFDQILEILEKKDFDFKDIFNHKILGIRNLFDNYFNYDSQYLLEEENKDDKFNVNSIDIDFIYESEIKDDKVTTSKVAAYRKLDSLILGVTNIILKISKISEGKILNINLSS